METKDIIRMKVCQSLGHRVQFIVSNCPKGKTSNVGVNWRFCCNDCRIYCSDWTSVIVPEPDNINRKDLFFGTPAPTEEVEMREFIEFVQEN